MDDTKALLWAAIEDYVGLWEAVWELRALHPDAIPNELTDRAKTILRDFLRDGLIHLYRVVEPDGEPEIIEDVEASGLLASPDSWEEPGPDWVTIRFSATAGGVQAYAGLPN